MYIALGLGFGVSAVMALGYLARSGELPMTPFGFRAFEGRVTRYGTTATMILGGVLVGVCALDVIAGAWLWQGRRRGARLGIATAAPAFALSAGFALPFLLVGVPIRTGLVLARRGVLR
jgi:hypothetical protein